MKRFLKIFLSVVAVIVLLVVFVFQATSILVETSDKFFNYIKSNDLPKAYELLSEEFKTSTSPEELSAFLTRSSLINYKQSSWSHRSISNGQGSVEGTIDTTEGGKIPIKISFVKENDTWKILGIKKQASGIITNDNSEPMPSKAELIKLTNESIQELALAINTKDFTRFYQYIARLWQKQTSKEELLTIFKPFADQEIDLTVLKQFQPTFLQEPAINENGLIVLNGSYPTQPSIVYFNLKFHWEYTEWKLVGINVELK